LSNARKKRYRCVRNAVPTINRNLGQPEWRVASGGRPRAFQGLTGTGRKFGWMATLLERGPAGITVDSADSPLGRWTVATWMPAATSRLMGFVDRIWYFDGSMTHAKERVFPDGRAEIVVMLDERHRDGDAAAEPPFPAVCINGLRTRPSVVVAPPGRCRVLGIRLEPLGACALAAASIQDLADVTIDLHDVLGRAAGELGERCADAARSSDSNPGRGAAEAVRVAAEWAARRIDVAPTLDPAVARAARAIRTARGMVSVDEIGSALGLSRAHLATRFRSRIGVTPKRFARIVRFSNALSLLGEIENIASAAAELSYYDQAHMYRDFDEFAGMTPGAFLAAERYPGSSSLAE
jgi:AraC-like DNA-binding protein